MRLLAIILLFSLSAQANVIYLSPSGNNANPGAIGSPKKTLEAAWSVVSAGDTIYLRGGTHAYDDMQYLQSKNGTSNNWIKVWGYPGETAIITRSASYHVVNGVDQDLIYVEGDWLWFQDLEIANFSQLSGETPYPALRLNPTNNSRFYRLKYHDNMSPMKITGTSHKNVFRDCDFYRNQDPYGSDGAGTDAYDGGDGLVIGDITSSTDTNFVYGCRFWWNADDGLDFWNTQAPTVVDSCWAFWNGYIPGTFTTAGNGSGFKFGPTDAFRKVTRCIASGNRSWGFVENQSLSADMRFDNNTAAHNGTLNYLFGFWGDGTGDKYFYNNVSQGGGCLFDACGYQLTTIAIESTNSWNGFTVTSGDWQSTDSTQLTGARSAVGTLPSITFLRPVSGSDLVNAAAVDYGYGDDLGALQYSAVSAPPTITGSKFSYIGRKYNFKY